jgi:hypothetical protein
MCPHTSIYVSSYYYVSVLILLYVWGIQESPSCLSRTNFNTPVKDLEYKDLLTSTFTLGSHERVIKTWCVPATYPKCVDCGKMYRYERFNVECQWTPGMEKQLGRKELSYRADLEV